MKEIFVLTNTKGGVGKSTIAWHLMPAITKECVILEIDDNNVTSIFKNSAFIKRSESITLKDCDEKLQDITFDLLNDTEETLVIDCGGGNDSKEIIQQIDELSIEELANITYIVPIMNSLAAAKNALDMRDILKGKRVIYALNNVNDMNNIKADWLFFFGSAEFDLESYWELLGKPSLIFIPSSPLFELSSLNRQTISDFAEPARKVSMINYQKALFSKYENDKEGYKKELSKYRWNKKAKEFLESFIHSIEKILIPSKNK